jgi:hypothetical protein
MSGDIQIPDSVPETSGARGGRPAVLLVAAFGVVAIVALVLWAFVFTGGHDVFEPVPSAADSQPASPTTPAAAADVDDEVVPPVETVEVFLSRDPFRPVRPEEPQPAPVDGDPTPSPGDDNDDTDTDPDPKEGDDSTVVEGREVELIDVFLENDTRRATIRVDSTTYTVSEGDTFAGSFRVLSIDPPCATLLYGDNQFTLCEGERVRK